MEITAPVTSRRLYPVLFSVVIEEVHRAFFYNKLHRFAQSDIRRFLPGKEQMPTGVNGVVALNG